MIIITSSEQTGFTTGTPGSQVFSRLIRNSCDIKGLMGKKTETHKWKEEKSSVKLREQEIENVV